jgi:hypothetical protein
MLGKELLLLWETPPIFQSHILMDVLAGFSENNHYLRSFVKTNPLAGERYVRKPELPGRRYKLRYV